MLKRAIKRVLESRGYEIRKKATHYWDHPSETSKCRDRLAPFCQGYGIDIGPGGDPITPSAIRVDLPKPYSGVGALPVQLGGTAANLHWFADKSLDYVYSSHVLEDFTNVEEILKEWIRVLKPGGNLVIYCPDQKAYEAHCKQTGGIPNEHHKDPEFSIKTVQRALWNLGMTRDIHATPLIDVYSWELVSRKIISYAENTEVGPFRALQPQSCMSEDDYKSSLLRLN